MVIWKGISGAHFAPLGIWVLAFVPKCEALAGTIQIFFSMALCKLKCHKQHTIFKFKINARPMLKKC